MWRLKSAAIIHLPSNRSDLSHCDVKALDERAHWHPAHRSREVSVQQVTRDGPLHGPLACVSALGLCNLLVRYRAGGRLGVLPRVPGCSVAPPNSVWASPSSYAVALFVVLSLLLLIVVLILLPWQRPFVVEPSSPLCRCCRASFVAVCKSYAVRGCFCKRIESANNHHPVLAQSWHGIAGGHN